MGYVGLVPFVPGNCPLELVLVQREPKETEPHLGAPPYFDAHIYRGCGSGDRSGPKASVNSEPELLPWRQVGFPQLSSPPGLRLHPFAVECPEKKETIVSSSDEVSLKPTRKNKT